MDKLRIWQQNVNTSPFAQHDLMQGATPKNWDIVAIQEPPISHLNLAIGITNHWYTVYPTDHLIDDQPRSRSLLLVSKNLLTNGWKAVPIKSLDITAIEMTTTQGTIQLINIYNDGAHDRTLELLDQHLASLPNSTKVITLGDFNRHHPFWDELRNQHLFTKARLTAAERLLNILSTHDLTMTLPAGLPTHELLTTKNYSRLDNVFMSSSLAEHINLCTALESPRIAATDHFAIQTKLDLSYQKAQTTERRDFQLTDWEAFETALRT